MKRELADFIVRACQNADTFFNTLPEIREDYSGRGMFGRTTTAITTDNLMAVMAAMACEAAEADPDEEDVDLAELRHIKTDSVGREIVLY